MKVCGLVQQAQQAQPRKDSTFSPVAGPWIDDEGCVHVKDVGGLPTVFAR